MEREEGAPSGIRYKPVTVEEEVGMEREEGAPSAIRYMEEGAPSGWVWKGGGSTIRRTIQPCNGGRRSGYWKGRREYHPGIRYNPVTVEEEVGMEGRREHHPAYDTL
eukprot:TRINITY_DN1076_c0_g1_i2.p4 TRINITY_DN1076_c0_g1~~TRINITY_DN1076_c0_g1_i2.p4  ORF type:complete len:107 (+),score=13.86 TRINITY_DN1076_c0_g1_i2:3-323(+)